MFGGQYGVVLALKTGTLQSCSLNLPHWKRIPFLRLDGQSRVEHMSIAFGLGPTWDKRS